MVRRESVLSGLSRNDLEQRERTTFKNLAAKKMAARKVNQKRSVFGVSFVAANLLTRPEHVSFSNFLLSLSLFVGF